MNEGQRAVLSERSQAAGVEAAAAGKVWETGPAEVQHGGTRARGQCQLHSGLV